MSETTQHAVDLSSAPREKTPRLPRQNYKLRIIEEPEFKLSKKESPMLVFSFEIADPPSGVVDGEEVKFGGIKLPFWAVFFFDEKKGVEVNWSLAAIHQAAGLPTQFLRDEDSGLPIDDSGVPFKYAGLEVWARCSSDKTVVQDEDGNPIKHPITGEEQSGWRYNVEKIYY